MRDKFEKRGISCGEQESWCQLTRKKSGIGPEAEDEDWERATSSGSNQDMGA